MRISGKVIHEGSFRICEDFPVMFMLAKSGELLTNLKVVCLFFQ